MWFSISLPVPGIQKAFPAHPLLSPQWGEVGPQCGHLTLKSLESTSSFSAHVEQQRPWVRVSLCKQLSLSSKKLDSTTARTHGESLYCKVAKAKTKKERRAPKERREKEEEGDWESRERENKEKEAKEKREGKWGGRRERLKRSSQACHVKLGPNESPKIYADTTAIKPQDGKVGFFYFWHTFTFHFQFLYFGHNGHKCHQTAGWKGLFYLFVWRRKVEEQPAGFYYFGESLNKVLVIRGLESRGRKNYDKKEPH